jgi:hypothetical protein
VKVLGGGVLRAAADAAVLDRCALVREDEEGAEAARARAGFVVVVVGLRWTGASLLVGGGGGDGEYGDDALAKGFEETGPMDWSREANAGSLPSLRMAVVGGQLSGFRCAETGPELK